VPFFYSILSLRSLSFCLLSMIIVMPLCDHPIYSYSDEPEGTRYRYMMPNRTSVISYTLSVVLGLHWMTFLLARRSLVFCQATSRIMVRSHWRLASRFVRHVEFHQRATHVRQPCPFNVVRECIYTSLHHLHFPSSSLPPPSPGIEKSEEQRDVLRALPVSCKTTQSLSVSFLWSFS